MPGTVAAVTTFLKTVGLMVGGLGISAGTALALGAATVVAGAVVAKKLIENIYAVPNLDSDRSRQATVRGTVEPQKLIYGEALVSGPISFVGVAGTDNRDLYHAIVLAGHQSTSISDIYFDDKVITNAQIDVSGQVTEGTFGPQDGVTICTIRKKLGTQTTADSLLNGAFNTINTDEHIGTNLTYIITKFTLTEDSQEIWDKYLPQNIKALVKGKKIYDPRQDSTSTYYDADLVGGVSTQRANDSTTWEWSENPVWCLVDYLTDDYFGMNIDLSRIDLAKAVDAADICDTLVDIPNSQQEKRFTCNGVVFGTASHKANINKLLSSMNGMMTYTNGKFVIRAGAFEAVASGMTLSDDNLVGPAKLKTSFERSERFNTITGTFIDPSNNYKEMEFPKVQITSALTRDNNEELRSELKLSMTNSFYMAQRIAHKLIQQSDLQKVLTFPTNLAGVNIAVGDRVSVTLSEFNYTNKTFVCLGWNLTESGSGGVNLILREDDSASYADMAVGSYSTVTPSGGIAEGFFGVPDPQNLSATASLKSIELDWTNPANMTGIIAIEVFASSNSAWSSAQKIGETLGTQFIHDASNATDPIDTGDERYYWVRARRFPTGTGTDAVSDRNPDSDTSTVNATAGESFVIIGDEITDDITDKIDEIISPIDSGAVSADTETAGGLVTGRVYEIQTVGTTDFTAIGADSNAVGEIFTATGAGSGTGTVLPDDTATLQTAFNSVSSSGLVLDGANKTYLITDDINVTGQFLRLKNFKFRFRKKYFYDDSLVNAGSFIVGRKYEIASLGTTVWTDIGYDDSDGTDPAAVGDSFTATGVGSGTGTANSDNWIDGRINCDAGSGTTKMTIELENIVVDGGRGTYKTGNEPWAVAVEDFFNYDSIQPDISASIKVNAFNEETDVRVTNCRFENIHSLAPIRVNSYGTTIIQDCVFKNMSFKSFEVFQSPDNGTTQKGRTLVSDVYAEDIGLLPDTYSVEAADGTVSTKTFSDNSSTQTESPQGSFNFVCSFGEYNITNASVKNYGSCGVTADRNQIFNASNITITNDSTRAFSNNPSGAFWLEDCILANITNLHIDVTARAGIDTTALDNSLLQIYLTDGTKAFFNNVFVKAPTSTAYFNKLIRGSGQHEVNCNIQNFHVEGICRNLDDAVSFLLLPNSRVEQDIRLAHGYIAHGDIKIDNPHHVTIDDVYLEGGYDSTIAATAMVADTLYEIVSVGTTDFTAVGAASNTVGVRFKPSGSTTGTGTVSLVYGNVAIFRAANADAGSSQIPDETHDFNVTNSYVYGDITNNTAITGTLSITNNKRIGSIASTSANNGGQTTVAHNGLITGSVQITSDGADGTAKVEIANNPLIGNLVLVDTTNTAVIANNVTNRRIEIGDVQNFQVVGNTAKTDRGEPCIWINPTTASNILAGVVTGNNCLIKTGTSGGTHVTLASGVQYVSEGLNNKFTVNWS